MNSIVIVSVHIVVATVNVSVNVVHSSMTESEDVNSVQLVDVAIAIPFPGPHTSTFLVIGLESHFDPTPTLGIVWQRGIFITPGTVSQLGTDSTVGTV